jgi:hypothetical protein
MLNTIWSGGQYGVDIAALAAAKDCGLQTGGWVPRGWKTKWGPRQQLAKLGLKEHSSVQYSPRTYANVKDTDGTLILAYDFNSPGTRCTKKALAFYEKPCLEIDLSNKMFIFDVTDWIDKNGIIVLNVAGNAGKTKLEGSLIFKQVREYLGNVFKAYEGD